MDLGQRSHIIKVMFLKDHFKELRVGGWGISINRYQLIDLK